MYTWRRSLALPAVLVALCATPARAQLTVSGEVTATAGTGDEGAYFNYTDYEHNALRMFRVAVSAMWRPTDRLAFLTEVRSENLEHVRPYALYVRVRPWKKLPFDVQAGRIPAVFGAYVRRSYGADNPLIGVPLVYQYLTSLRADAIPASADGLLEKRGLGWLVEYPVGAKTEDAGVPIFSAYRWDTGVEAHAASRYVEGSFAVTSGTISNPRVDDDNNGRQFSGRVAWKPVVGLVIGASAARGEFLNRTISDSYESALGKAAYRQRALGVDAEYSRGYWIVRGELIDSRWNLPRLNLPFIDRPLRATGGFVEGKYRFTPRFYLAARADHLTFSNITGAAEPDGRGGRPTPWDAPVSRAELGGGLYVSRHVIARAVLQYNLRAAPVKFVRTVRTYASGQLTFRF